MYKLCKPGSAVTRCWVFADTSEHIYLVFGPFLTLFGTILWVISGTFGTILGPNWGIMGSLWDHFWQHFGVGLVSLCPYFGVFWGPFSFPLWVFFTVILRVFGDVLEHSMQNWAKMIQEKANEKYANFWQNLPKFIKISQKLAFFAYQTIILLKKRSKSTFQPMKVCFKRVCMKVSWVDFECF